MYLDPMKVSTTDKEQSGPLGLPSGSSMLGSRGGCWVHLGGIVGEETNTAIQYGLFGCIYQESYYRSSTGSVDTVPLPSPPPNPSSPPSASFLHAEYCSSTVTPAPALHNVVYQVRMPPQP